MSVVSPAPSGLSPRLGRAGRFFRAGGQTDPARHAVGHHHPGPLQQGRQPPPGRSAAVLNLYMIPHRIGLCQQLRKGSGGVDRLPGGRGPHRIDGLDGLGSQWSDGIAHGEFCLGSWGFIGKRIAGAAGPLVSRERGSRARPVRVITSLFGIRAKNFSLPRPPKEMFRLTSVLERSLRTLMGAPLKLKRGCFLRS